MKKKKLLTLCAAFMLAFTMTACSGGQSGDAGSASAESTAAETAASVSEETAAAETTTAEESTADTQEASSEAAETEAGTEDAQAAVPTEDRVGNPITVPEEVNSNI